MIYSHGFRIKFIYIKIFTTHCYAKKHASRQYDQIIVFVKNRYTKMLVNINFSG